MTGELASWRVMLLALWDEQHRKLVGFRHARKRRREEAEARRSTPRDGDDAET